MGRTGNFFSPGNYAKNRYKVAKKHGRGKSMFRASSEAVRLHSVAKGGFFRFAKGSAQYRYAGFTGTINKVTVTHLNTGRHYEVDPNSMVIEL